MDKEEDDELLDMAVAALLVVGAEESHQSQIPNCNPRHFYLFKHDLYLNVKD